MKNGILQRPYIGVVYIPVTESLAKQYNLPVNRGAYIPHPEAIGQTAIIDGGPADKAGIKSGDIITKVKGKNVDKDNSLTSLLGMNDVGDEITLTIVRDEKEMSIRVQLQAAPTN
jgi:serine protease Do